MLFSIIYEVDGPTISGMQQYYPPKSQQKDWDVTERGESDAVDGWKHRKFCAVLNAKQFRAFIDRTGLEAESTRTMGMLGAPGCQPWYGCLPAISFNSRDCDLYINAYVCPIMDKLAAMRFKKWEATHPFQLSDDPDSANCPDEPMLTDRDWERMRLLVFQAYGDHYAREEAERFGDTVNVEEGVEV